MMRTRLIVNAGVVRTDTGFDLAIRLPWYRALPLSTIDLPVVAIDGVEVASEAVSLGLYGIAYDARALRAAEDVWWYVLDDAVLHVAAPFPDGDHDVSVEMHIVPPYIPELTLLVAATRPLAASVGQRS